MIGASITVPLDHRGPYRALEVRLATRGEDLDPVACLVCKEREATLELAPTYGRPQLVRDPDPIPLCGSCLSAAVSIRLGALHVKHGGDLGDLRLEPGQA